MTLQADRSTAGKLRAMNPTNQFIYDAVIASPVGKAMTPDQRAMLEQALTGDADPRAVQGWLGEQIRKAASSAVAKGDYEGHPFRGNQWTTAEGQSQGGAGSSSGNSAAAETDRGRRMVMGVSSESEAHAEIESITSDISRLRSNGNNELANLMENRRDGARDAYRERFGRSHSAGAAPETTGKTPAEQRAEERDAKGKGRRRSLVVEPSPKDGKPKVNAAGKKIIDYHSIESELEGKDRKEFDSQVAEAKKAIKVVSDHLDSLDKRADESFKAAEGILDRETRNKVRSKAGDQSRVIRDARWQLQQAEKVLAGLKPTVKGAINARVKLTDLGELAKGRSRQAEQALDEIDAQIINGKSRLKGLGSMTATRVRAKREASMPKSRQGLMPETALQDAGDKWFGVNNEDWDLETAYEFIDN